MSSLASRRVNCNSSDGDKVDLQKLDIPNLTCETMENIYEDGPDISLLSVDNPSTRQGAETAPAYGIVSESELALKRYSAGYINFK